MDQNYNNNQPANPYTQNFYEQPQYRQPQPPPRKEKKNGFGTKLAKCAAIALVFGLVAGGTFTGVSYAGMNILGIEAGGKKDTSGFNSASDNVTSDGKDSESKEDNSGASTISATNTGSSTSVMDVSGVVQSVMPSIVAITNIGTVEYQSWFGQTQTYESESCGSGIIVAQDDNYLYIVSNNHVVSGADTLTVQFSDNSTVSAEVQGTASSKDLAVIKVAVSSIEESTLGTIKMATLGDSTQLAVGEPAIAIGNALGYGQSVTTGCISALGRSVTVTDQSTRTTVVNNNLIQTDAAINPGNSGGALLNAKGEVIGINSVKYSDTDVEGIGYAIPISDAWKIIEQLISTGVYVDTQSAYIGIQGQDISSDIARAYNMPRGVYIYEVVAGAAAANAGLRQGDILTGIDDAAISNMNELKAYLENYEAGDEVTLHFYRISENGYVQMEVKATLSSRNDVS